MNLKPNQLTFGPFQLDPIERCVWKGSVRVALAPKPLALLQYLARHPGHLATKEELLEAVWPDTHVVEAVLKTSIAEIRRALGDEAEAPELIETVQRRGYRFIAPVAFSNLPDRQTTFVGREKEVDHVKCLLRGTPLVTLVGPAGVGKTSLALTVASDLLPDLSNGSCWIDLATLSDPELVAQLVATTVGVFADGRVLVVDTLIEALSERRMLLVLDNCEHVIDGCAPLVDSLIHACPNLRVLATSREPLQVDRETTWLVPALSVPQESVDRQDLLKSEAARLFVERATQASSSFSVTDDNVAAIAAICRRLDGLPLAIELAAVRVKVLAPEQIAARLGNAFGVLGKGHRTRLTRHQTLGAALDWSYDLLSTKERALLGVAALFAGSFTLAAAEAACEGNEDLQAPEVLDVLTRLVERSLIHVVNSWSANEKRYQLLEIVRQYVVSKRPQLSESDTIRRVGEFLAGVAEEIEPSINTAVRDASLLRLDREYANVRAALEWSHRTRDDGQLGLRIAGLLGLYWMHRGLWREGQAWLEKTLERYAETHGRAKARALCGAGILAGCQGQEPVARARLEESVIEWRTTDDELGLGFALDMLGQMLIRLGEYQQAEPVVRESIALFRRVEAPWYLAVALDHLGVLARCDGRFEDAASLHEDSAAIMRSIPDPWGLSIPLRSLTMVAALQGDYGRAETCVREALIALRPLEDRWFVALTLEAASQVRCRQGCYRDAAQLLGAAEKLRETVGAPLPETRRIEYEPTIRQSRGVLGEAAFRASWAAGRALSREGVIAMATGAEPVRQ